MGSCARYGCVPGTRRSVRECVEEIPRDDAAARYAQRRQEIRVRNRALELTERSAGSATVADVGKMPCHRTKEVRATLWQKRQIAARRSAQALAAMYR